MLERALSWYASAYDWTVVAFRYFNACGGTSTVGEDHRPETHIIPLLLQVACGERESFEVFGHDYPTPDGTCLRDYVHVLDIADAHIRALQAPERPGMTAYNIGTGTSFSVRHVCQVVEKITGTKLRTRDSARRVGDPAILCADPKRLMTVTGVATPLLRYRTDRPKCVGVEAKTPRRIRGSGGGASPALWLIVCTSAKMECCSFLS